MVPGSPFAFNAFGPAIRGPLLVKNLSPDFPF
jgi:hypothetical protein